MLNNQIHENESRLVTLARALVLAVLAFAILAPEVYAQGGGFSSTPKLPVIDNTPTPSRQGSWFEQPLPPASRSYIPEYSQENFKQLYNFLTQREALSDAEQEKWRMILGKDLIDPKAIIVPGIAPPSQPRTLPKPDPVVIPIQPTDGHSECPSGRKLPAYCKYTPTPLEACRCS